MANKNVCKTPRWRLLKSALNNLTAKQFLQALEEEEVVIIDVRRKDEYETVRIANAVHLDYFDYQFLEKIEALDPSKTILVYCRSGRRSIRVCTLMKNGKFDADKVFNLEGGILDWMEQAYPVEK